MAQERVIGKGPRRFKTSRRPRVQYPSRTHLSRPNAVDAKRLCAASETGRTRAHKARDEILRHTREPLADNCGCPVAPTVVRLDVRLAQCLVELVADNNRPVLLHDQPARGEVKLAARPVPQLRVPHELPVTAAAAAVAAAEDAGDLREKRARHEDFLAPGGRDAALERGFDGHVLREGDAARDVLGDWDGVVGVVGVGVGGGVWVCMANEVARGRRRCLITT